MKCAIYARVSTKDKQDYERQVNELTAFCKGHGYSDDQIEIFPEKESGYKKDSDRPQMNSLLNKIDSNPKYFKCVYVLEISRIGRTGSIIRGIIDRLKAHKIPLYIKNLGLKTLDDNGEESIATNIIIAVFSEIADEYARTFKANSKSGLRQAAIKGKALGGKMIAYGYRKDEEGYLVVDDDEAEVIREIFSLYQAGNGIKVISNILNSKGVATRTNKAFAGKTINYKTPKDGSSVQWSDKQVHDILRNPIYCGKRRHKGEFVNAHIIITEELFEECNAIMKGKTHRNYLTTYTYLLKDLMVCGFCGRNYFAKYKPAKITNGKNRFENYYLCSSKLKKGCGCSNVGINISLIESTLFDILINSDAVLKYISNTHSLKKELGASVEKLEQLLTTDKKMLVAKGKEEDKLIDLYQSGGISKSKYFTRIADLEKILKALNKRIGISSKELREKKRALTDLNNPTTNKKMLKAAKGNRPKLQEIFRQIFHKVIINKLDDKHVLATVFLTLNGTVLKNTLKVLLDVSGIRRKPQEYRYKTMEKMDSDPVFNKNNILLVDATDILRDFFDDYYTPYKKLYSLPDNDWSNVSEVLTVEEKL